MGAIREAPLRRFIFGVAEAFGLALCAGSEAFPFSGERVLDLEDALSLKGPVPTLHGCLPVWRGARSSVSER